MYVLVFVCVYERDRETDREGGREREEILKVKWLKEVV